MPVKKAGVGFQLIVSGGHLDAARKTFAGVQIWPARICRREYELVWGQKATASLRYLIYFASAIIL